MACFDCKGLATRLRPSPLVMGFVCVDRELCHKTQLFEAMIATIRSG
jgi:hypothetical protein